MTPTPTAANPHRKNPGLPPAAPAPRSMRAVPLATAAMILSAAIMPGRAQTAATRAPDEAVVLSPFVVQESDNVGYSATTTLSGTRLNTAIRDVGASISIVTPEFMNDIAATDLSTLLAYTLDTEVGGISGNFAGGGSNTGRPDQSNARENPQSNQRVRGVGPASITRDYFLTDIPLDSYNISRITINRGPNSLLFGIGNPAGIIEGSLIKAQLQRNQTTLSTRYGSENSLRATIDHNQVLIPHRLALRLAGLNDKENYAQKPAYDANRRLFGTIDAVLRRSRPDALLGRTTLRASYEAGEKHGTPVNVIPPTNAYSSFYALPDPAIDALPGVVYPPQLLPGNPAYIWKQGATVDNRIGTINIVQNVPGYYGNAFFQQLPVVYDSPNQSVPGYSTSKSPALAGIAGIMGHINYTQAVNHRAAVDFFNTRTAYQTLTGFVTPTLQDANVFDYRHRLMSGSADRVEQNFAARNVTLEQELFGGDGGLELAYNDESLKSFRTLPFSAGQNGNANGASDIYIDVSQYLSNDEPNPNVGRPFIEQQGVGDHTQISKRESYRLTGFYSLNLEKQHRSLFGLPLGNHTFGGLYTTQDIRNHGLSHQEDWNGSAATIANVFNGEALAGSFLRPPVIIQYVGPSAVGTTSADQLRITNVFTGHMPQDGEVYPVIVYDKAAKGLVQDNLSVKRFLSGESRSRQKIASSSFSVKSDFFDDDLVNVIGWRRDRMKTYSASAGSRLPDGSIDPAGAVITRGPDLDQVVTGVTWSIVGRLPARLARHLPLGTELSAYYNQSGNFNPVGVRTDLNGRLIPTPAGKTKEYGVIVEMLQRRLSLRVNWFHTDQENTSTGANGATSAVFGIENYFLRRYIAAEKQGIAVADISGATAAGYNSYDQLYAAVEKLLPEPTNSLVNSHVAADGTVQSNPVSGLSDTTNLEAKGLEVELVGNLTPDWRVSANLGRQETILNGSARLTRAVADYVNNQISALHLAHIDEAPTIVGGNRDVQSRFIGDVLTPLSATIAQDGAPSQEQRKWRANFVTFYDFRHTEIPYLKEFGIGTAVRWQSRGAIGNYLLTGERLKEKIVAVNPTYTDPSQIADTDPIMQSQYPDLQRPIYAPAEVAGDFWITYHRKLTRAIDWRLQLNFLNAWGDRHDIPIKANPDGTIAQIRIPNEQRVYLTSTFSF